MTESSEPRINLYEADKETLLRTAGRISVYQERWNKGDGLEGVDLQGWFEIQRGATPDEMFYKDASGSQIMFVRDQVAALVFAGLPYDEKQHVDVVGEHRSKSVALPVYRLVREDLGLRIYLRDNFYDWKLSIDSAHPINCDFAGLFKTGPAHDEQYSGRELASCYFEGFPEHLIFGHYGASDGRRWSASIGSRFALWTSLYLMMRSLGVIGRAESDGPQQHRRSMDAETARRLLLEKFPGLELPPLRVR
jgi:hypothetical protein